jgi:hypothetical protein
MLKFFSNFIGMAFLVYALLFCVSFTLYMNCTAEYSGAECKDNTLTHVVTYPFKSLFN